MIFKVGVRNGESHYEVPLGNPNRWSIDMVSLNHESTVEHVGAKLSQSEKSSQKA
jgi:hypothetical protein